MIDRYKLNTVNKAKNFYGVYRRYLYETVGKIDCEISEISAPAPDAESLAEISTSTPADGWRAVSDGEKWGGDSCYAWFRGEYTVPKSLKGKTLLLKANFGAPETLLFLDKKPAGIFDICDGIGGDRIHEVQPLTFSAEAGESFSIMAECCAGYKMFGNMVYESEDYIEGRIYPKNTYRTYYRPEVLICNDDIATFLTNHRVVCQMVDCLPQDSALYADAVNALYDVFSLLPQRPSDCQDEWIDGMREAVAVLKSVTSKRAAGDEGLGYVGLIGHSHLDTAWLWPVRETVHKAARTFSNALRLMEHYPDYRFIQSSVLYIDWMKKYYSDIYEGIKKRTAENRWEPNGGAWVECDDNIPGGEYIIRQFVKGQRYTRENLGYSADCFWQPDTFGYSAALPQILKGCGLKYFLTTKLSWNEANKFPYDTFYWNGIDGTEILTHFNLIHKWPDFKTLRTTAVNSVQNKDVTNMKLLSYGFGDGGGGPSYSMLESEKIVNGMVGMPRMESTTVSKFMKRLEETSRNVPVFEGELYLELHRGTLTQMHDIKRSNRMLEKAIHNLEIVGIMSGAPKNEKLDKSLETLLTNQFHDILPGTAIPEVNKVAIHQNYSEIDALGGEIKKILGSDKSEGFVLCNTLSWERNGFITADDNGKTPDGAVVQRYTDIEGKKKLAFSYGSQKGLSAVFVPFGKAKDAECPFTVDGDVITTPFATVILRNGSITSLLTKDGFEVVRDSEKPLNTFYMGDDIPLLWDNWDIDYDQQLKMKPVSGVLSSEIVSCGALQLRVRVKRKISGTSTLEQDIVFYSDTPRIDFETVMDWNESHKLLKVGFDVNVRCETARHEIQFGNIKRPTHENYPTDKSQFEVSNHKWTDLSDNRFGAAILNDCKYGISVSGSDMRLTLHKAGCHPDPGGDRGRHTATYSLLVHNCGFSTDAVIRPAYELNYPVICVDGENTVLCSGEPMFTVSAENVIIETVKYAEDGNGFVLRLYETEGSHACCRLMAGFDIAGMAETDMLEYEDKALETNGNAVCLDFKPFEIKTVRCVKK